MASSSIISSFYSNFTRIIPSGIFLFLSLMTCLLSAPFLLLPYYSHSGSYTTYGDLQNLTEVCNRNWNADLASPQDGILFPWNTRLFRFFSNDEHPPFMESATERVGLMALVNSRVGGIKGELTLSLVSWLGMKNHTDGMEWSNVEHLPPPEMESTTTMASAPSSGITCPEGFENAQGHQWYNQWMNSQTDVDIFSRLHCLQMKTTDLRFLKFSRSQWESQKEYLGPREEAQDVKRVEFIMPERHLWHNVSEWFLEASVLHFGETEVQCNSSNYVEACKDHFASLQRIKYFSNDDQQVHIPYRNESVCFEGRCAGSIRLGTHCSNYFWKEEKLDENHPCHFTLHYLVVSTPSIIYPFDDFWKYSALAFVSSLFLWLFVAFYFASVLHTHYLNRYYVAPNQRKGLIPDLSPGDYTLCLEITAASFSKFRGILEIRQEASYDCMLRRELDIDFDEETVQNTGLTTVTRQYQFTAEEHFSNLQFYIEWEGERTISDFKRPECMAIVSRRVPPLVFLPSNICCAPLYACFLCCCFLRFRKYFVLFQEFIMLALYLLGAHFAWMVFVCFALLMNSESVEDYFWGDSANRPALVVLIYVAFILSVLTPAIILFNPRKRRKRSDFLFSITGSGEQSHIEYENPFNDPGQYIRLKESFSDDEDAPAKTPEQDDFFKESHHTSILSLLTSHDDRYGDSYSVVDDLIGWG